MTKKQKKQKFLEEQKLARMYHANPIFGRPSTPYKKYIGNPTRWRSVKQDLQTQSQKRHRADKRIKNV